MVSTINYQSLESTPTNLRPSRILIVEDQDLIRDMLVRALKSAGYNVITAIDGQTALKYFQDNNHNYEIDLVILDLMLPLVNGLDICRFIRYQGNPIPILMISAKATESDRVLGLEVGADDYLAKPFGIPELIARCKALLRRQRHYFPQNPTLQYKEITIYLYEKRTFVRGQEVNLSPKEFKLLELFMNHPRRVWEREQLIDHIWGNDFTGDNKTVDVHIRWLREKLEKDPKQPEYILTIRGFGYRFG